MARRRAAGLLAEQHVAMEDVAAVLISGSLGRGRAGECSDVELDVDWHGPPSDDQRRAPATAPGGELVEVLPYDRDEAEWSEDVRVSGVGITVSGFARDVVSRWSDSLGIDADPAIGRQMRLSVLHEGEAMYGAGLVAEWRESSVCSRMLSITVAERSLRPRRLIRWCHWRALQHRADLVMLQRALRRR